MGIPPKWLAGSQWGVRDNREWIDSGPFPSKSGKGKSFRVIGVTATSTYDSSANHDPDGDSDGTTIDLIK